MIWKVRMIDLKGKTATYILAQANLSSPELAWVCPGEAESGEARFLAARRTSRAANRPRGELAAANWLILGDFDVGVIFVVKLPARLINK